MKDNIKNYKSYSSIDPDSIEDEDIANYPQDAYIRPGDAKTVGKLDGYNKEKANYNNQKAKVILKDSKIASQEKSIDDLIPQDIGNAIDNVFSKVDNLLNATGKLFFGGSKPKAKATSPRPRIASNDNIVKPQPVQVNNQVVAKPAPATTYPQQQQVQAPVVQKTVVNTTPAKVVVQQQTQAAPVSKPQVQQPAFKSSIVKPATKAAKVPDEEKDTSPPITRTTMISDLDLPIEILNDPDLVRYFDQMKLYDKKVEGGLCTLTQNQASEILKKGRWGKVFMITYDQLKINTITSTSDAGTSRFNGMSPVYKAQGRKFANTDELRKAVEKDINMYIKNGEGSGEFHKFTYRRK